MVRRTRTSVEVALRVKDIRGVVKVCVTRQAWQIRGCGRPAGRFWELVGSPELHAYIKGEVVC